MQGDASGGLDVTLLVAVAALAPAHVEYSLDRRCPQQSLNPLGKRSLDHILHVFAAAGAQGKPDPFHAGGREKKVAGKLQDCERLRPATPSL